jgi:hypothetical protein
MTGRQVIWIAIVFIIIAMTWGDPQPASSSTRQLPLQSVGLNDVDDDNDDNDMPLGAAGYIRMASIQSCVNTIGSAARDTALVDLSHGSRAPPRAPAELIYRVVLLSLPTVFDRSEVCGASSLLGGSSLETTESNTPCLAVRRIGPVLIAKSGFVFAYVLSGSIRSQVEGEPLGVYSAGQTWTEPPNSHHIVSANASKTKRARLIAYIIADDGAQATVYDK